VAPGSLVTSDLSLVLAKSVRDSDDEKPKNADVASKEGDKQRLVCQLSSLRQRITFIGLIGGVTMNTRCDLVTCHNESGLIN